MPESALILGWKYLSSVDVQVSKQKTERQQTHAHAQKGWVGIFSICPVQQEGLLPSAGSHSSSP